jgi:hypothetical protein
MHEHEGGGASRTTDPAAGSSAATDVSLREYLSQQIQSLREHFDQVQKHNDETMASFRHEVSGRFDGVNEFRGALEDLSARMATKDGLARVEEKFEGVVEAFRQRLSTLERRFDVKEGQAAGTKITTGVLVTVTGLGIAFVGLLVVLANYFSKG